ncbi:MAG: HAD-IIB family hydrolase [Pseudomonadota bacterium]
MLRVFLVATDLDGSLLSHEDYRYDEAKPVIELLEQLRIPLVFVSSKTRPEILELRAETGNSHPFIVENGSAVYLPKGYFDFEPEGCKPVGDFLRRTFSPPRDHWAPVLHRLREQMPGEFRDFSNAGVAGIAEMTGLEPKQAAMANEREFSEPVKWLGSDSNLEGFVATVRAEGGCVYRGGRFFTIAGETSKGTAYRWLRKQYEIANDGAPVFDLCVGDGANDVPMLEVSKDALLIPNEGRPLPQLERTEAVWVGEGIGPAAWASGVSEWLHRLYQHS